MVYVRVADERRWSLLLAGFACPPLVLTSVAGFDLLVLGLLAFDLRSFAVGAFFFFVAMRVVRPTA